MGQLLQSQTDFVPVFQPDDVSKYHHLYHPQHAYNYCLMGATDETLATFFEVTDSTIGYWRDKHKAFRDACRQGKGMADANVAMSLYHRAIGWEHTETKLASHEGVFTDSRDVVKQYPADTEAIKMWLNNRQPELWKNKVEVKHSFNLEDSIASLTDEQEVEFRKLVFEQDMEAATAIRKVKGS